MIGPPLFKPRTGLIGKILNPEYVAKTHNFFERYGNRALILARFVPIVRTFVTLVAGVGRMDFRKFITYTAIGGVLWACGVTMPVTSSATSPSSGTTSTLVLILIVLVSLIPMGIEYLLHRQRRAERRNPVDRYASTWVLTQSALASGDGRTSVISSSALEIISAGHPESGGDILLDLLDRGGAGDHRADGRHRRQSADRDLKQVSPRSAANACDRLEQCRSPPARART